MLLSSLLKIYFKKGKNMFYVPSITISTNSVRAHASMRRFTFVFVTAPQSAFYRIETRWAPRKKNIIFTFQFYMGRTIMIFYNIFNKFSHLQSNPPGLLIQEPPLQYSRAHSSMSIQVGFPSCTTDSAPSQQSHWYLDGGFYY